MPAMLRHDPKAVGSSSDAPSITPELGQGEIRYRTEVGRDKADVLFPRTRSGSGLDIADVRYVFHLRIPGCSEILFRRAGRPGATDNEPSPISSGARPGLVSRPASIIGREDIWDYGQYRRLPPCFLHGPCDGRRFVTEEMRPGRGSMLTSAVRKEEAKLKQTIGFRTTRNYLPSPRGGGAGLNGNKRRPSGKNETTRSK
ncbi:hypothetical protein PG988_004423 [Apiospora saccharicola]